MTTNILDTVDTDQRININTDTGKTPPFAHHLFPAVPTIKLPELAKRIDEALPEINKKQTF